MAPVLYEAGFRLLSLEEKPFASLGVRWFSVGIKFTMGFNTPSGLVIAGSLNSFWPEVRSSGEARLFLLVDRRGRRLRC